MSIDLTNAGNHTPIAQADMDKWELRDGAQAQPTGRLLSCDNGDAWASEEWSEPGTYDGEPAERIYLFAEADITRNGEPMEAEDYPWDDAHTARIVLL